MRINVAENLSNVRRHFPQYTLKPHGIYKIKNIQNQYGHNLQFPIIIPSLLYTIVYLSSLLLGDSDQLNLDRASSNYLSPDFILVFSKINAVVSPRLCLIGPKELNANFHSRYMFIFVHLSLMQRCYWRETVFFSLIISSL